MMHLQDDNVCLDDGPLPVDGDTRKHRPEEELLFAVLFCAVEDYLKGAPPAPSYRGALRERAISYFTSARTDWGSFVYCCQVLKLDPDYVWEKRGDWQRWYDARGRQPTPRAAA